MSCYIFILSSNIIVNFLYILPLSMWNNNLIILVVFLAMYMYFCLLLSKQNMPATSLLYDAKRGLYMLFWFDFLIIWPSGQCYSLLSSGQVQSSSTSLRKPSYSDFGKRENVGTKDGLLFDPCFDSSFPDFFSIF